MTSGRSVAPASGRWVARPRPVPDPALRLLSLPHVGGGGATFNAWLPSLPAEVELCAVRFPGRENRLGEPLVDDLEELLDGLVPALAPLLDRPFVVLGHCSGSVIAYEYARRLHASGADLPARLILSSTPGPRVRTIDDPLHLLPREELVARVVGFGGMAEEILEDAELMSVFARILRADYRVIERAPLLPAAPLPVPITVLGGRNDPFVDVAAMAAWSTETTAEFTLHLLCAGHYLLPDAGDLVGQLMRTMTEPT